jgi:hypothetical protein
VAIVDITNRYEGAPAIEVALQIFGTANKKGYFSAKLVDLTGSPQNQANEPTSEFEKRAAKEILKGKEYFEEVVGVGKDRRLMVATMVPAVVKKCASCHGVEKGDLLGFVRYEIPVK